jgi:hypothetical protein
MMTCQQGHPEITYSEYTSEGWSLDCPICELLEEVKRDAVDTANRLVRKRIEALEQVVCDLLDRVSLADEKVDEAARLVRNVDRKVKS